MTLSLRASRRIAYALGIGILAVSAHQGVATAVAGKTLPTRYFTDLEPCANEDGPAPCAWDASSAGNGTGHSYWLDATACIHYLAPADARKWDDWGHGPCADPYEASKPRKVRECQDAAAEGDDLRMAARFAACWVWPAS